MTTTVKTANANPLMGLINSVKSHTLASLDTCAFRTLLSTFASRWVGHSGGGRGLQIPNCFLEVVLLHIHLNEGFPKNPHFFKNPPVIASEINLLQLMLVTRMFILVSMATMFVFMFTDTSVFSMITGWAWA